MKRFSAFVFYLFVFISLFHLAFAAGPLKNASQFEQLQASDLTETAKNGRCIIFFEAVSQPPKSGRTPKAKEPAAPTNQRILDDVMKAVATFKDRISSSVRLYRIPVKDLPWAPAFITYDVSGREVARVTGPFRPDAMPWLVHEIMDYYAHSIPTEKGDYLRAGWLVNDTNVPYVNMSDMRKEEAMISGRTETVQIVEYASTPGGEAPFAIRRSFARDGKAFSSIETYGPLGSFGYYDHDRTGKFQYRVKQPAGKGK